MLSLTDFMMKKDIERPELEYFHTDYIGHAPGRNGLMRVIERLVGKRAPRASARDSRRTEPASSGSRGFRRARLFCGAKSGSSQAELPRTRQSTRSLTIEEG